MMILFVCGHSNLLTRYVINALFLFITDNINFVNLWVHGEIKDIVTMSKSNIMKKEKNQQ